MKSYYLFFILCTCCLISCKKYLDAKPDKQLVLASSSVANVQDLLDYDVTMNLNNPGTGEVSADNYYITDAVWAGLTSVAQRNMYIWGDDITLSEFPNHWSRLYLSFDA